MSLLCSAQLQDTENACGSLITDRLKTHGFGIHYFTITNNMIYSYIYAVFPTHVSGTDTEAQLLDRKNDEE